MTRTKHQLPKYIRFQLLRIKKTFIFKLSCIKKAELCYVYGYGCVLPSLNYKVKKKKRKSKFCDIAGFGNNR